MIALDTLALAVEFATTWGDVPGYPLEDEREFMWIVDEDETAAARRGVPFFVGFFVAEWSYIGGAWTVPDHEQKPVGWWWPSDAAAGEPA